MSDFSWQLTGICLLLLVSGALILAFRKLKSAHAILLGIGTGPVAAGYLTQLMLLIIPGSGIQVYRILFILVALIVLGILIRIRTNVKTMWNNVWIWAAIGIIACLPLFFIVTPVFSSFDPANYYLIGKAMITEQSLAEFPFVHADRTATVFSWFAHPPTLSAIYGFLNLFHLEITAPYVASFYALLLILLILFAVQNGTGAGTAILLIILLLLTPVFVRTAALGFTAPLRMFFLTAMGLAIADDEKPYNPLVGVLAGIFMTVHLIGILAIPAAIAAISLCEGTIQVRKWIRIVLPALLTGGFWYAWNLIQLGSLDSTRYLTAKYPDIVPSVFGFQFAERGMATLPDLLTFGLAGPFTRFSQFGLSYWIGALSLMFCLFLCKGNRLVRASAGICLVYLAFHLLPLQHHISWLSPRYPLTVLPLFLLGASPLFRGKRWTTALITATTASAVLVIAMYNPYHREPDYYGNMKSLVDREIASKDKVLVVHAPYFFIYNPQANGLDSIDPRLADLYQMESLDRVLKELRKNGFTHILMPWAPTPFETNSFVRKLFINEDLVEQVASTRSFHLYRLRYPDARLPEYQKQQILNWPEMDSSVQVIAYANERDRMPARVWTTPVSVESFAVQTGSTVALARSPLWNRGAGTVLVSGARSVRIRMHLRPTPVPCLIHPVIATYDDTGKRLELIHPLEFRSHPGWVTLQYSTAYPGFKTEMIPLASGCNSIAIGFNYYRESGGLAFDGLAIEGFHP